MVTRDFSGEDVVKVLGNKGNYKYQRMNGDHAIMKWTAPSGHDTDNRTVSIPMHDRIKTGTLRNIMEQAGGEDFEKFCQWIDRNR